MPLSCPGQGKREQRYLPSHTCPLLLLLFSRSVVSDSLWPREQWHVRLPCPSISPGVCSDWCPLRQWCHPTILCCPLLLLPSIFPSMRVFSNESTLCIRWPKCWSFSISPSNEYSGLISFRMDWLSSLQSKGLLRVFFNTTVQKHPLLVMSWHTVGLWRWGCVEYSFFFKIFLKF